ncbi:MAG: hypothetical protein PVI23_16325, partial [Maricaulaceae bacterium]
LKPGLERQAVWAAELSTVPYDGFSISDERLFNFTVNENAEFEVVGPRGARRAILRSSGEFARESNHGVHYHFPIELTRIYEGGQMNLDLTARSSMQTPTESMFVRCVAPGVTDSGWMRVPVETQWETKRVVCDVPPGAARAGFGTIIWSDAEGDSGWVELREIRVLVRPPDLRPAAS